MSANERSGANAETSDDERKHMSATEILKELPKLKQDERRAIARRVFELEEDREELEWAAQAADLAFQELDKQEELDASSKPR